MGNEAHDDAAALAQLGRWWADAGFDDPTSEFCILFDGSGPDEDEEERAEAVRLIDQLGLERVEPRDRGAGGEIWVRYDDRLRAEIDRWA